MSDDEFMPSCDSADYDFGYSDGSAQMEDEDDAENNYYSAKAQIESDPHKAYDAFRQIAQGNEDSEIGIKANKQTIKLLVRGTQLPDTNLPRVWDEFLDSIVSQAVNQSYREQSFLNMLEIVQSSPRAPALLSSASHRLASTPGCERLAGRTTIKLATAALASEDFDTMNSLVNSLGPLELSETDQFRTTLYLEVLALRIQAAVKQGTGQEEKLVDSISLGSHVQMAHPRILAIIRECGGVIAVRRRQWPEARALLLKAFKSYDEAGSMERTRILRLYIVCSILSESALNPFDSQEILAYKDSDDLSFLHKLFDAFTHADARTFKVVMDSEYFEEPLVAQYMVPALLSQFQGRLLDKSLRPYSRVTWAFIAAKLEIEQDEVPRVLTQQVLAKRLPRARIDDAGRTVSLQEPEWKPRASSALRLPLPARYQEFAASTEQNKFERAILLAQENKKKAERDFSGVFTDLVEATYGMHVGLCS